MFEHEHLEEKFRDIQADSYADYHILDERINTLEKRIDELARRLDSVLGEDSDDLK